MTKILLFILFSTILSHTVFAQRIEYVAAANYNQFYSGDLTIGGSNGNTNSHEKQIYRGGFGYACSVGIDDIKFGKVPFKFTLLYDHYSGGISYYYTGLGNSNIYDFNTRKDLLGVGIYPLNLTWFDKLRFSLGTEFNFLIHAQQSGTQSIGAYSGGMNNMYITTNTNIDNHTKGINNVFYAGINLSLRYECKLSEEWRIAPQAMMYLPMNYEFKDSYSPTISFRPYLGIAVIKNLKVK